MLPALLRPYAVVRQVVEHRGGVLTADVEVSTPDLRPDCRHRTTGPVVSIDHSPTTWFSRRTDPEHILGRGFEVALTAQSLHLLDPDVDTPSPPVLRSAWGLASRTSRPAWPYDFRPSIYAGVQMWDDRDLAVPDSLGSYVGSVLPACGRGAYVSHDEAPPLSDTLEFVFLPDMDAGSLPQDLLMAQVLLDLAPTSVPPFAAVARRVVEPVIRDLRAALADVAGRDIDVVTELHTAVERVELSLQKFHGQPSRLRRALKISLAAVGSIVLGIVSTRLDPVLDHVDWPRVLTGIGDAVRRLGIT